MNFRTPLTPLSTHASSTPPCPSTCDLIYGCHLNLICVPAEEGFSPVAGIDGNNAFGEDMLQMALKMATEYEEQPVDLESAMTANTITPSSHPGMPGEMIKVLRKKEFIAQKTQITEDSRLECQKEWESTRNVGQRQS